ncbi:MAG: DUF2341 domain-containing protein, partial [Endomicrobiales bacterium]
MDQAKRRYLLIVSIFLLARSLYGQAAYTEDRDTQFNAGSYSSTCLSGTGSSVSIGLEYYGRSNGLAGPDTGTWFDPAWKYRQPITLTSANPSGLTDYRVPVTLDTQSLIAAGRMTGDGADLRFTTSTVSGSTQSLSYCIESGLNSGSTRMWVKVPWIPSGTPVPLYLYYGNPSAVAQASMASTKVRFDGIEIYSAANTLTFSNPYLYLEGASAYPALTDFLFDTVFVSPYASPEPEAGLPGQEQGRYYSTGSFLSQVKDTGAANTKFQSADWNASVSSNTALTVAMRA